nr:MAG TPA: hypothetical protein [Caudoviricetes sp.]
MTRQMKKQIDEISFYQISISIPFLVLPLLHASGCFIKKVPNRYPCCHKKRRMDT